MPALVDEWPEYAMEGGAVAEACSEMSERMLQAMELLADHPLQEFGYDEVDAALSWPARTFQSIFGGWRSSRGSESLRPFHLRRHDSARNRYIVWMDREQAAGVSSRRAAHHPT